MKLYLKNIFQDFIENKDFLNKLNKKEEKLLKLYLKNNIYSKKINNLLLKLLNILIKEYFKGLNEEIQTYFVLNNKIKNIKYNKYTNKLKKYKKELININKKNEIQLLFFKNKLEHLFSEIWFDNLSILYKKKFQN